VQTQTLPTSEYLCLTIPTFPLVVPGPPVIVNGSFTSSSLSLRVRLSQVGTSPLNSLHTVISAADRPIRTLNVTGGLKVGGVVGVVITNLSPGVSYTVNVYVMNGAGRSKDSPQRNFTTG